MNSLLDFIVSDRLSIMFSERGTAYLEILSGSYDQRTVYGSKLKLYLKK